MTIILSRRRLLQAAGVTAAVAAVPFAASAEFSGAPASASTPVPVENFRLKDRVVVDVVGLLPQGDTTQLVLSVPTSAIDLPFTGPMRVVLRPVDEQ